MFGIGPTELIIVLVLALIIFGPGKLPEVGKAIGRSIKEFKSASSAVEESVQSVTTTASSAPASSAQPAAAAAQNSAPVTETTAEQSSADSQKSS